MTSAAPPPTETQEPHPRTLLQISCDGFTTTVDAMAANLNNEPALLFISLVGTQAAARALTANIMANPVKTLLLQEIDPESDGQLPKGPVHTLHRAKEALWRRRHRQLPLTRAWHSILWDARIEPDHPSKDFILISTPQHHSTSAQHLAYLRRRLKIPFHPTWADWAWTRAIQKEEATPLAGTNLDAWYCHPNPTSIREDITQAVKTGLLTT